MKIINFNKSIGILGIVLLCSCEKFLDIDAPKTSLVAETAYQNNDIATSALTNIYSNMSNRFSFASGGLLSITCIAGTSSDEFISYNSILTEFSENQLTPINSTVLSLYRSPYICILNANSLLEGLDRPNGTTHDVKAQLQGEAHFIRAFLYFYLVNLFGAVPLQLSSDYNLTRIEPKATVEQVYVQILNDLKQAEALLTDTYVTAERVRPNLAAVQSMLARVYLFNKDWQNAEKYSSLVIGKTNIYALVALDNVFLKNSQEAIWQLMPPANTNTADGSNFILGSTPTNVSLRTAFVLNAFGNGDKRQTSWIKSFTNSAGTFYYPFKYKVQASANVTEYSMVLRLSEQYLIRAEARAEQNNIIGSIDDLDKIRNRAGTSLFKATNPGTGQQELLTAIQSERRTELFSEWGHRWFDLKRTGLANSVLGLLKSQWQPTDILYPIPYDETSRNPNITQNAGY